jgi:serine/threonine-protein kinase
VGRHRDQALEIVKRSPFQARVDRVLSSRPRGEVVRQLPEAGNWKATGSPVVVSVSLGVDQPDRTTVPDVTGEHMDTASAAIQEAGFTPRVVFVDSSLPFQTVVNQNPDGGERAAPGSEVHIGVSKGPGEIQ